MDEFVKAHKGEIVLISSLLILTLLTVGLVTASGKVIVMELDGVNFTAQDGYGNYEEKHIDGGKVRFYAE